MKTLRTFFTSILVVGLSGFSIPSFADDTELYVRSAPTVVDNSNRPNLLFIIDNSGSLLEPDMVVGIEPDGKEIKDSRLNVLTSALLRVLDEAQNVNIGLERFTFHHGAGGNTPIVYPVSYIDEPVPTSTISLDYKVQDSADDAEEGLADEPVIISDKVIEMTRRVGTDILFGNDIVTTSVAVAENADDSRESLGNTKFYPPVGAETAISTALAPIPVAGTNYPTAGPISSIAGSIALGASVSQQQEEIVGLRFKDLNVPKNATILAAWLDFTANAPVLSNGCNCDGTPLNLQIKIQDSDSAGVFSDNQNGKISGRTYSDTTVNWFNIPAWDHDQTYSSADISNLLQGVVNRNQWSATNNAVVFSLARTPLYNSSDFKNATGTNRRFYSAAENLTKAAVLKVVYTTDTSNPLYKTGAAAIPAQEVKQISQQIKDTNNDGFQYLGDMVTKVCKVGGTALSDASTDIRGFLGEGACSISGQNEGTCWGKYLAGFRFENLPIPKGNKILKSSLEITSNGHDITSNYLSDKALNLNIFVQDSVTAPAFSGGSYLDSGDCVTPVTDKNLSSRIPASGTPVLWSSVPVVASGGSWSAPAPVTLTTPDLSALIQPLINKETWSATNALAFLIKPDKNVIVEGKAGITGTTAQKNAELDSVKANRVGSRRFYDWSDTSKGPDFATKLKISYVKVTPAATQKVGFRFQNVNVPKGATITNAYLKFGSGISADGAANLEIRGQKSGDAAAFQEVALGISGRPQTGAKVDWNASSTIPLSAWTEGQSYRTPDLKTVVQEIINQSDWCGGNSMAFAVTSTDNTSVRNVVSFDASPDLAPALHIEFDPNTIPSNTCVNQTYFTSVKNAKDDGVETLMRGGAADHKGVELNDSWDDRVLSLVNTTYNGTKTKRMTGVRFPDIPLSKDQEIVSAKLIFTATSGKLSQEDTNANGLAQAQQANLVVVAEKGNAKPFEELTGNFSGRTKTSTAINWTIPATEVWKENRRYSVDVTNIVKEVIGAGTWETYGNMAFFVTATDDTSLRKAASFDQSATISPALQIKVRGLLGSGYAQTARQFMKQQVLLMDKSVYKLAGEDGEFTGAYTPTVDGLYEGAMYFRGENVTGSANNRRNKQYFMVSYPTSHDKPIVFSQSHTNADGTPKCNSSLPDYPFSDVCASEKLASTQPPGRYKTPIKQGCQANHIVLVSDGLPTKNTVAGAIIGGGGGTKPANDKKVCTDKKGYRATPPITTAKEECEAFLTERDAETPSSMSSITCAQIPDVYKEFDPKNLGGYGQDHKCGPELAAFLANNKQIVGLEGSTIKTHAIGLKLVGDEAPAEYYLKAIAKAGKGDYYRADTADDLLLAFQTIIATAMTDSSSFASPAVSVNVFNRLYHNNEIYFTFFKPTNKVAWDGNVKRYDLCTAKTGCASSIVGKGGTAAVGSDGGILPTAQEAWSTLTEADGPKVTMAGAGGVLPAPNDRKIYSNVVGDTAIALTDAVNAVATTNSSLTTTMLDVATEASPDAARTELVNWIRGYTDATAGTLREWRFGDPLHSTPGVFTYGQDDVTKAPKTKVIVNTNEGAIRMLDGKTGVEDWMFIPRDMLAIQKQLKNNEVSSQRLYGIDGRPVVWVRDHNYNGKIEGSDSVWVFTGMRRGGRNVYAMDVTPDTSNPPAHKPRLVWTIFGGQNTAQGDFTKLGQTWSTPVVTKVLYNGQPKTVVLFGGGFDATTQDVTANYQQLAAMGNTIYMVDPLDGGKLLWSAGSSNNSSATLKLTGMNYSFPSDLTVIDGDGDGLTDRIYVGDTGGQLWRVDIRDVAKGHAVGGRLATLGSSSADAGKRRFFYPPDVARLTDVKYSPYATDFDLVLIGSGHRPNPLNKTIQDRLYAFRDRQTGWLVGDAGGGKAGNAVQDTPAFLDQTVAGGSSPASTKFFTITEDKLYDATTEVLNTSTDVTILDGAKADIQKSLGWKVELANLGDGGAKTFIGEKALAKPLVLSGIAYYTTFVPPQPKANATPTDACQSTVDLGTAKSYAINILTGESSDPSKKRAEERGGGIPAEPIAIFTENGVTVYVSVGSGKVDDPTSPPALKEIGGDAGLPRETVYWIEE
jgi:type IV pilus assembly protein PilY1